MEMTRVLRVMAILVGALFAINCYAQESTTEEWPGTLKRKGKQRESITLNVKITDEGPVITEMIYAGISFEFKRQAFSDDRLVFSWTPGDKDVECNLKMKDEGKFVGKCLAEGSDNKIEMLVKPKRKESELPAGNAQDRDENEARQTDKDKDKEKGKSGQEDKGKANKSKKKKS